MDMRAAFKETVELAEAMGLPEEGMADGMGLDHLRSMQERISEDFSEAKLGRWLGWAQCALVAAGCVTLEEMKEINRRHSGNDEPHPES